MSTVNESEDIVGEDSPTSSKQKPDLIKTAKKFAIPAGGFLILLLIISAATNKPKGGPMFGICKTFMELKVDYPESLHYTAVEQYPRAVRIYFMHTDPFGFNKSEMIECGFEMHPELGAQIETILLNREQIDQETIKKFNQTLPGILAAKPDLTLPKPIDGSIKSLKR